VAQHPQTREMAEVHKLPRTPHLERLKELGAVALLALLCLLFFWRLITSDPANRMMLSKGDFGYQFYAWRVYIYDELRAGRLPLWITSAYAGHPLQADPQSALFYPVGMAFNAAALVAGFETFPFRLLEAEVIWHVFLASAFTYAFLRAQVRRRSALLGGIVFAYGGYLAGYPLLQMAILESAVWLPVALWGVWQRYHTGKRMYLWLTAAALALSVLAGHPQTAMLVIYSTVAYLIYQSWRAGAQRGIAWAYQTARDIVLLGVVTVAFSAVQIIPSLEYMRHSTRADLSMTVAGSGFPLPDIVQFVLTGFVSYWQPLYVGIWPLLLVYAACAAAMARQTHRRVRGIADTWFWLGLVVAALLLSFGQRLFFFDLLYQFLPGYGLFRQQERLALLVSFGLSVLAAFGSDLLWQGMSRAERRRWWDVWYGLRRLLVGMFLALMAVVFLQRYGIDPSDSKALPDHVAFLWLMLGGSVALLYARLRAPRQRALWQGLALGWVVLNLFSANASLSREPLAQLYALTPPLRIMTADQGDLRFQDDYRLVPHSACVFGLEEIGGIAPLKLADYDAFMERVPEVVRWKLLNVKYVVTWRGDLVSREGAQVPADLLYREGEGEDVLYLYRLQEPGPRAWLVHRAFTARDAHELYGYMSSPQFNPQRIAVLMEQVSLGAKPDDVGDRVEIAQRTPQRLELTVETPVESLLVLSEVMYPGWQAYVDGRPVPIYTAYGLLRAIVVPAGASRVTFAYQPFAFYAGAAISACAWLLLVGWTVVSFLLRPSPSTLPTGAKERAA